MIPKKILKKFCSECGTPAEGGKFCAECGSVIDAGGINKTTSSMNEHPQSFYTTTSCSSTSSSSSSMKDMNSDAMNGISSEVRMMNSGTRNGNFGEVRMMNSVPDAASGKEATEVYSSVILVIEHSSSGNNSVNEFKANCRQYGQGQMPVQQFYDSLTLLLRPHELDQVMPNLLKLIPDYSKRKALYDIYQNVTAVSSSSSSSMNKMSSLPLNFTNHDYSQVPSTTSTTTTSFPYNRSLSVASSNVSSTGNPIRLESSCSLQREDSFEKRSYGTSSSSIYSKENESGKNGPKRYSDHPICDICNQGFEYSKRRHQCRMCGQYVCSMCSPARLLIPPGHQIQDAKGYDPAILQRVCTVCAPALRDLQQELSNSFANCHKENPHVAKGRFHMPYSQALDKECRNAADIIGNFFRPEFGAANDRSIPVAFLEKAHGLAFLTIVKGGFLITARVGTGLVVSKLPDGSWSAPSAIGTAGIGGGFEIGGEVVELMIILGSKKAVDVFHRTQVNVGAGLDVTVGPYGRAANAQAAASKSGLNANYSYSHSKGLFAGFGLHGAVITCRKDANANFYGRQIAARELLEGEVEQPRAARCLYEAIQSAMEGVDEFRKEKEAAEAARAFCSSCHCSYYQAKPLSKKCKNCGHYH